MTVFFVAAHIAFARFEPMLSSKQMADTIMAKGSPSDTFIIYGEQSSGSSLIFYTNDFFTGRPALLVVPRCGQHSEGSTLLWGSCYPDAPDIYLSDHTLAGDLGRRRAQVDLRRGPGSRQSGAARWPGADICTQCKPSPTRRCGPTGRCRKATNSSQFIVLFLFSCSLGPLFPRSLPSRVAGHTRINRRH